MDLGDGRGSDRRVVEPRIHSLDFPAELELDRLARQLARKGRQVILQPREIGGDLFAQQIGARRQCLAELDEARAHLLQCRRQPLARPPRLAAHREEPCPGDQRRRDPQALERKQRIVACEAQRDAQQAPAVAQGAEHLCLASPGRSGATRSRPHAEERAQRASRRMATRTVRIPPFATQPCGLPLRVRT